MRKILEIWTKGQTFPKVTLDKLSAILAGPSAGPSASNSATLIAGASSVAANGATLAAPVLSPGLPPLELPGMDRTRSGTGPREGELIAVFVFPVLCSASGSGLDVVEDVGLGLGVLWSHMSPTSGGYSELSDSNVERLPWPAKKRTKTSIYLASTTSAQEVQADGFALAAAATAAVLTPPSNIWHCRNEPRVPILLDRHPHPSSPHASLALRCRRKNPKHEAPGEGPPPHPAVCPCPLLCCAVPCFPGSTFDVAEERHVGQRRCGKERGETKYRTSLPSVRTVQHRRRRVYPRQVGARLRTRMGRTCGQTNKVEVQEGCRRGRATQARVPRASSVLGSLNANNH
jgi:hypothetical protein